MTRYQYETRCRSKRARLIDAQARGDEDEARRVHREIWDLARDYRGVNCGECKQAKCECDRRMDER
jgi:hypothetical protein